MNERFKKLTDRMPLRLQSLLEQPPIAIDDIGITQVPPKGVYVFFEVNKAIYVGRSNRLKERLKEHSQRSAVHNSATLAIRMAKRNISTQQKKKTTKQLMEDSNFVKKFEVAKNRIARTEIRFIDIKDQAEQAMFEMYAILALKTEFNDFGTH